MLLLFAAYVCPESLTSSRVLASTHRACMSTYTPIALLHCEQQQNSHLWMYCMLDAGLLKLSCTVLYAGQVAFGSGHFHGVWMEAGTVPQSQDHREAQAIRCSWLWVLCSLHQLWVAAGTTCYVTWVMKLQGQSCFSSFSLCLVRLLYNATSQALATRSLFAAKVTSASLLLVGATGCASLYLIIIILITDSLCVYYYCYCY